MYQKEAGVAVYLLKKQVYYYPCFKIKIRNILWKIK